MFSGLSAFEKDVLPSKKAQFLHRIHDVFLWRVDSHLHGDHGIGALQHEVGDDSSCACKYL
ncbi:hypothetical protein D3C87_2151140 [compost metagenome]